MTGRLLMATWPFNTSFWPCRNSHMLKHSMSILLLFSTLVQGPLHREQVPAHQHRKVPWLHYAACCPQLQGLAVDQLLPCLYWMVLQLKFFSHLAAALITLILVQCPSFGFMVGLSLKKHLLWRAHQSWSGWVSINSVQGTPWARKIWLTLINRSRGDTYLMHHLY